MPHTFVLCVLCIGWWPQTVKSFQFQHFSSWYSVNTVNKYLNNFFFLRSVEIRNNFAAWHRTCDSMTFTSYPIFMFAYKSFVCGFELHTKLLLKWNRSEAQRKILHTRNKIKRKIQNERWEADGEKKKNMHIGRAYAWIASLGSRSENRWGISARDGNEVEVWKKTRTSNNTNRICKMTMCAPSRAVTHLKAFATTQMARSGSDRVCMVRCMCECLCKICRSEWNDSYAILFESRGTYEEEANKCSLCFCSGFRLLEYGMP